MRVVGLVEYSLSRLFLGNARNKSASRFDIGAGAHTSPIGETMQERPTEPTLAVMPIADHPAPGTKPPVITDADSIRLVGQCAPFCALEHVPAMASSVDDHGPWCTSLSCAGISARDDCGEHLYIDACLVALYTNGVYKHSELAANRDLWRDTFVRLTLVPDSSIPIEGEPAVNAFISIGDARRLAAALSHAADMADRLDRNLNDALAERAQPTRSSQSRAPAMRTITRRQGW